MVWIQSPVDIQYRPKCCGFAHTRSTGNNGASVFHAELYGAPLGWSKCQANLRLRLLNLLIQIADRRDWIRQEQRHQAFGSLHFTCALECQIDTFTLDVDVAVLMLLHHRIGDLRSRNNLLVKSVIEQCMTPLNQVISQKVEMPGASCFLQHIADGTCIAQRVFQAHLRLLGDGIDG